MINELEDSGAQGGVPNNQEFSVHPKTRRYWAAYQNSCHFAPHLKDMAYKGILIWRYTSKKFACAA
jgi:hypothetical protein